MLEQCRNQKPWLLLTIFLLFAGSLGAQSPVRKLSAIPDAYPNALTGGNYMHNFYLPPPGTGSPWWPSWSPDGKWIAFSMQGSIWKVAVEADRETITIGDIAWELVSSQDYLSSPEWSPDGKFLVFTAERDRNSINLRLLELETGVVTNLTAGEHLNLDPVWTTDSARLAYVSTRPSGYFNIFVMPLENGEPGEVEQLTEDHRFGKSRLYFGDYDVHIQPTWSPTGDELMLVSNRDIPLGSGGFWRLPVGGGMENATLIHKEETLFRSRPDWSSDGSRILYSSHLGGQFNNLFVLPAKGGEPYKLTFGQWDSFHPRWSPDGEWIAYIDNRNGPHQIRFLKTFGGTERELQVRTWRWQKPHGRVRVRVRDEAGNPMAARIYNRAADGKTYVPHNAYHRIGRLDEHFFHTAGTFVLDVPEGNLDLEAMRGFEFLPAGTQVTVRAGDTVDVNLSLRRIADLTADGFYSGSNHVHMNYAGNLHNTPENLIFMSEAEEMDVIGEMVANKDNRILDNQFFTGELHPLSSDSMLLFFNEEYRPPFYGHISLINLTEHLISPFTTGYEGTAIESLYPSNTDIFRLARKQGAIGAYVHPFRGAGDPLEAGLGGAKGFPVDLALGALGYHELLSGAGWAAYDVWHHALNNGFRLGAVGGEDSISNLHSTAIVGQVRTYAQLGPKLTWDGWLKAIVAGNSFVTNGPLLSLSVAGREPGETVELAQPSTLSVEIRVRSIVPLDGAALLIKGTRVPLPGISSAWTPETGLDFSSRVDIDVSESSWITLQAWADGPVHPLDDAFPQATTNPVWVTVLGKPVRSRESADYFIRWIDKLTTMAEAHPGWRSDREKDHVLSQFQEARRVYARLLNEAGAR